MQDAEQQEQDASTYITKLSMKGFKSFQRRTAVPFYEGLTAIVGRNGSGKSNIIDALSFVMGQRSSNLRAKKLEQLIFNGGEDRKPADEAVVTLYLDNETGVFDEFLEDDEDTDEITIGRKITRNGYATYRFEGHNCKRSKIDQILDKARINPDGFHFVGQGEIKDIINRTTTERRKIIDRLSGIASYEDKREQAEEELDEVDERLQELRIKQEMKKDRLEQLREQKEDAETYRELEDKKDTLSFSILTMRKRELTSQLEGLEESEKKEKIDRLDEAVNELDDELEERQERKDEINQEIEDGQDTTIIQEIERIKGKIERKKGEIDNKRSKINDIEGLLDDYEKLSGYQGRNSAVKAVLDMSKDGIHGTLGQLLHYDDRFSVALETAMGAKIDNIVVDSRSIAVDCVNYLKRNNIGRATFLPLDKVSPRSPSGASKRAVKKPGAIDIAINLVDFDQTYNRAVKHVLGDTIVAKELDALKSAGRVRAVTLDGDIMRKGGSITGGKKKRSRSKQSSSKPSINPEEKREQKEQLEDEIKELKKEIGQLHSLLEEKQEDAEEQSQISDDLKDEKGEINEKIDAIRDERREKAEELNKLQSQIGQVEKKRAKFEAEIENVEEDLEAFEQYDEDGMIEDDVSNLRRQRTKTINKMNDLGNVNMKAIEEFKAFKEKYDEFAEKLETVMQEKKEIEQIIEDIEAQKRQAFMDTLRTVDDAFSEIFTQLFDGGEAYLELEEERNIDSGLQIQAHPPDKEPHVIDSLSGGEKALTAISFVFALQEYDPSPLYVMDEIDAALDPNNCKEVATLLSDYAEESQVIFISHNEETVADANRAYGVSMRDGVSKVRSIELDV